METLVFKTKKEAKEYWEREIKILEEDRIKDRAENTIVYEDLIEEITNNILEEWLEEVIIEEE